MTWLDCYGAALDAHFPEPTDAIRALRSISASLPYTPPEERARKAMIAWGVYEAEGDTDAGRAAVLLTYVLAAMAKGWIR